MRNAAILVLIAAVFAFGGITVINLTTQVTGTLPTARGGTGQSSTATFPGSGTVMVTTTAVTCGQMPALIGSVTSSAGACTTALAAGSYVQGVFSTFCTGTATASVVNFVFAGFGGKVTTCADSTGTTAVGGMKMPTAGTIKNLFVNLSAAGKSGDKVIILKGGSATGAPTCTFSTATTCNDVATSLTVAAGDVITISLTSGASETASNVAVSFELWN